MEGSFWAQQLRGDAEPEVCGSVPGNARTQAPTGARSRRGRDPRPAPHGPPPPGPRLRELRPPGSPRPPQPGPSSGGGDARRSPILIFTLWKTRSPSSSTAMLGRPPGSPRASPEFARRAPRSSRSPSGGAVPALCARLRARRVRGASAARLRPRACPAPYWSWPQRGGA